MPYLLSDELIFPNTRDAWEENNGLVAVGGDLRPERLLLAYTHGIFPWYSEGEPVLWWSPSKRAVLLPNEVSISRSNRKQLRKLSFTLSSNQAFEQVIRLCAETRKDSGTWITEEIIQAYTELHRLNHAQSVEVWEGKELVGGLYGIKLGSMFCGESMFNLRDNAAKFAFYGLATHLFSEGFTIIDCQIPNDFLTSLGATTITKAEFESNLTAASGDNSVNWPVTWQPTKL